jgi:hypothetical protein
MLECGSADRQVNIWSGFVLTKSQRESLLLATHQFIEESAASPTRLPLSASVMLIDGLFRLTPRTFDHFPADAPAEVADGAR